MKILIVDDEESMHDLIGQIISSAGYDYCIAVDGNEALNVVETERPALIILDVMLPGINGFELCKSIRDEGHIMPIIFLTAKGDIVDKSTGFKNGGDDYLVKPFVPQELLLRIEALLRRREFDGRLSMNDEIIYDTLEIDVKRHKVFVDGQLAELTPKEFHLLSVLASNPGIVFTRDQLIEYVWGKEYLGESSAITVFVRKIREKIEKDPANPKFIQTIWRIGYRFGD
jgi:two-component system response regulator VicR